MTERARGRLITLEGIEGSGKSTQARRLTDLLAARGVPAICLREPGGTALADAIRGLLLDRDGAGMSAEAELLLYAAARADHVRRVVLPALVAGTHVICDRFSDSTRAYQGAGRGLPLDVVEEIDRLARGEVVPDVTLLLDLDADLGLERARRRNAKHLARGGADEARLEDEDVSFHRRVRSGYLRLAGREPHRIWVIDASGEAAEVTRRVEAAVRRSLPDLLAA